MVESCNVLVLQETALVATLPLKPLLGLSLMIKLGRCRARLCTTAARAPELGGDSQKSFLTGENQLWLIVVKVGQF